MMDNVEVIQGKRAAAWYNGDFILVETYSGHRLLGFDETGAQHFLQPNVDDEGLGRAVLDALGRSRFMSLEEVHELFALDNIERNYVKWTQSLMERYGYRNKRQLFSNMKNCSIAMVKDIITISPSKHDKLEGWGRDRSDGIQDVVISAASSAAECGAALRLAFERCE